MDAAADGYGRAEACVALWLECGASASTSTRPILAGSAVNQDGRSAGLTAPSGPAQAAVLTAARAEAGAPPTALELHGTGTPLGDPIELGAAASVLAKEGGCTLLRAGGAKSRVGHAEPAAGAVGLAAAIVAATGGPIPPLPLLRSVNPHVVASLDAAAGRGAGLALARAAAPGCGSVGVGVSAFAFAGTNAHAVVLPPVDGGGAHATASTNLPWRRARAWFAPPPHALLWRVAAAPHATVFSLPPLTTTPATAYLHQHVVAGVPLLPAAVMLEAAAAAVRCAASGDDARPSRCVVASASVAAPYWLARDTPAPVVNVTVADDGGVTVASSAGRHLAARAVWVGVMALRAPRRRATLAPRLPPPPPPRRAVGNLTPAATGQLGAHWHHPACLDAATHAAAATARGEDSATPRVPVAVSAAWLAAPARVTGWATAAVSPVGRDVQADVGVPGCGVLVGFTARAAGSLKAPRARAVADAAPHLLYDTVWQVEEPRERVAALPPSAESVWLTATLLRGAPPAAAALAAVAAARAGGPASVRSRAAPLPDLAGGLCGVTAAAPAASAAAVWGVLRCATQETPAARWAAVAGRRARLARRHQPLWATPMARVWGRGRRGRRVCCARRRPRLRLFRHPPPTRPGSSRAAAAAWAACSPRGQCCAEVCP